jgi:hypothetical protein
LDELGILIQGLQDVRINLNPIKHDGKTAWYNPDLVHDILTRNDSLPSKMSRKALTRYLRNKLDIRSVPVRHGLSVVRLYIINWEKIKEFGNRYFGELSRQEMV